MTDILMKGVLEALMQSGLFHVWVTGLLRGAIIEPISVPV
jgi:hypothetical protein